jgi:hypothetical protein
MTSPRSESLAKVVFLASFALRLLSRVTLAVWFGGFTVYAAVVVPDLHANLGGMETGEISRRVAPYLYAIGAAALALAWLEALTDRDRRSGWLGKSRLGLLALNSFLLITLVLMHRSLGIHLDSGGRLSRFHSLHEVYLTTWTVQWLAILGLMAIDAFSKIPKKEG